MASEATRELFALINLACGSVLFLALLAYVVLVRPRRALVALALLLVCFICVLNSFLIYFFR